MELINVIGNVKLARVYICRHELLKRGHMQGHMQFRTD